MNEIACKHCGVDYHASADCPSQYPLRTVRALERIVQLLEKQKPAAAPKRRTTKPKLSPDVKAVVQSMLPEKRRPSPLRQVTP